MSDEDYKVEIIQPPSLGGQHTGAINFPIRVTHIPTGLSAESGSERSQLQNKNNAMSELQQKLAKIND